MRSDGSWKQKLGPSSLIRLAFYKIKLNKETEVVKIGPSSPLRLLGYSKSGMEVSR